MGDELDLSGDGGVLKTTIKEAKTDAIGPTKDLPIVDVHYELSFADTGEVFYNTWEDEIFSFETYSEDAIEGLDIALRTMKVGEIARIRCEPEYAYGSAGSPPDIPPNTALCFEVELMACGPRRSEIPDSPLIDTAELERTMKLMKLLKAAAEREEKEKKMREAEVEGGEYCLTADGGVKKEIIRKAKPDAIGPTGDLRIVVVHHHSGVAVKETGETCILDEGPILTLEIGVDPVIRGWNIALRSMKVGDIARITCKPEYAYGEEGSIPVVPPNATLICELELLACHSWRSAIPGGPSEKEERLEWERQWQIAFKKWEMEWEIGSVDELLEKPAKLDAKKDQRKGKEKAG